MLAFTEVTHVTIYTLPGTLGLPKEYPSKLPAAILALLAET
jgi:hypothetical protein